MNTILRAAGVAAALALGGQAMAQVTFYEREGFHGRSFTSAHTIGNFGRAGFNDRASSIVVERGHWEVCEHPGFQGRCAVLRPGSYPSLREFGMNNMVSSVRPVEGGRRHGPGRGRGRDDEHQAVRPIMPPQQPVMVAPPSPPPLFQVPVTSVRAVMGPPQQRCWVERQQVQQPGTGQPNVAGAVVGGLIGGALGHQVGGGSGKDVATAGGIAAGAVIGANMGRNSGAVVERDMQRCESVTSGPPAYYQVSYTWQGQPRMVQMAQPPGATMLVDGTGQISQ